MTPRFTISILALNNLELSKRCINAVLKYSRDYELILTNNGSTDGTTQYFNELEAAHDHIRVVQNNENLGFQDPNRRALEMANGEYFVMLNNDTEIKEPGWLEKLALPFNQFPRAAASGPCSCSSSLHPNFHGYRGGPFEYIEFSTVMLKADIMRKVGLFDENLHFCYAEDSTTCLRLRELGYTLHLVDIPVVHHGGKSGKFVPNLAQIQERNHAYCMQRWAHYLKVRKMEYPIVVKRKAAWGDVLLTTPIIRALKEQHPLSPIWVETDCTQVFDRNPYVEKVAWRIQPTPDALVIDLNMASENALNTHFVDAYAQKAGLKNYDKRMELFMSPADKAWAESKIGYGDDWIAVHAGPVAWPSKQWPMARFAEMLKKLHGRVVLVGSPGNTQLPCELDLRGNTSVHQMAAVIERCQFFIGLDSFPLHVAQAVGTPAIGLFGVTDPRHILTSDEAVGVHPDPIKVPSFGMRHRVPNVNIVDDKGAAINAITVKQVLDAVGQIAKKEVVC